jgi:hypothetical protein
MTTPRSDVAIDDAAQPTGQAKRWTRVFLGTVLGICFVLATVNLVVNPYGYYFTRVFPPLTWSSRETKLELLRHAAAPEVIVLGSSRTMKVAPVQITELTGKRAFNACVDSARVEDWYAMYGYARDGLAIPMKEVVLGIDIEAFHDHSEPDGRLLAAKDLRQHLPSSMRWKWLEQTAGLVGYAQTIDSVRSLRLSRQGYPPPPNHFDADGLAHDTVVKRFDPKTDTQIASYEGRFAGFTDLDAERRRTFEELLERASHDGVRVRAFVTPLHPLLLERLRKTRDFDHLHRLLVTYLSSLTARFPAFTVTDFTEIEAFGGDPTLFTDGAHTNDENSRRMTAALWRPHALQ